ncbi:bleomycin hydrolase [Coemansia thaxteri]|uniref:Cysteine proteinase 1, mitochondrial n=1 Tax=Coemansia thaxteri TaxID=2663907 RepID=A0A9W8EM45_9FUNG|nr:bleomycin hydrolase [Coemansia thaxteri]
MSFSNSNFVDFCGRAVSLPHNGFLGACTDVEVYEKLNRIGEGTYGIVYRARHRHSKKIVALKRMRVEVGDGGHGLPLSSFREIALLKQMRHPNIVSVLEIAAGHKIDSIFMVMEYCECDLGTLLDGMKSPFSYSEVKSLLQQLLCGLEYCHNNFVVHRDLKLPNMLLTRSGDLKIADFGLARLYHKPTRPMTPQVVTLWYRAPELILGATEYMPAIDLWSVGCIMGELLTHRPFMPGHSEQEQLSLVVAMIGAPNERIWPGFRQLPLAPLMRMAENKYNNLKVAVRNVSANTILLLNALLTYDPRKRLTAQHALDHPYFYEMPAAMTVQQFHKHVTNAPGTSSYARHLLTKHIETNGSPAAMTTTCLYTEQHEANRDITPAQLSSYKDEFDSDIKNKLATLTISRESYTNALENRYVYLEHPPVFSHKLAIDAPITNQKSSGRCWLFAGLNMLRQSMMKEYNLDALELSQPYLFFYDKLEKSNWFLENILVTLDEDLDGRVVQYLLKDPIGDGGQWDMFVALIEKYGVVPKEAYPETFHTSSSGQMDGLVTSRLREYAKILRNEHARGKGVSELRAHKRHMLEEVHRIMAISLGHPPAKLTWAFYDKDKKFHEFKDITPQQFYKEHVKQDCASTVSLINDPRNEYMKKYTVKYLGNVVGAADQVHYINLPAEDLKKYAAEVIKAGRPVWFGCDVGKFHSRNKGMMDPELIDYRAAFNFGESTTKAERLQYGESMMTHAMVLTGVHVDDDRIVRWRIENSWGKEYGNSGYLTMTDRWFDEYVYQIVLEKSDLPKEVLAVLDQDAVVLPPWDPMGALAK